LLSVILGLAIISAVFSIIALLIESFFNLKLRNPKIENNLSEVILNPEGFNLAELLSFEVAESCWKTIRFANIKKLSEVDSHPIFYFLLKENKNLEFIFSRATIHYDQIKRGLRDYLNSLKVDSSDTVRNIIDFLVTPTSVEAEQVAKLVHGSSAVLIFSAANNVGVRVWPRGTILYRGANDQSMIHLVYEFEPIGSPFSPAVSRESILCTPLLRPKNPLQEPWFELLTEQPPGLSVDKINACLEFLNPGWVGEIGRGLN
jgi:hypothetical protein